MILEHPGPEGGECLLCKTTKIILQISRGSQLPCFRSTSSACYPTVSLAACLPNPGNALAQDGESPMTQEEQVASLHHSV